MSNAEHRFVDLSRRRANALTAAKGTARWWNFLVVCKLDPDTLQWFGDHIVVYVT